MESERPDSKASEPNQPRQGTHVEGDVNTGGGHFIGRDNIIQIGAHKIPRVIAPLFVIGIVIGLAGIGVIAFNTFAISGVVTAPTPTATPTIPTPTPTATLLPTATPLAFATAAPSETLILLATFHNTAATNAEVHKKIQRTIEAETAQHGEQQLRVEVEPSELTADQRAQAEGLGKRYQASMVIWGEDTGVQVIVNFLNLKEPRFAAASATITETERSQLANPSAYVRFITGELPQEMSFFALFALGQSYYLNTEYPLAIERIQAAVALLPPTATPDGLADAYFRLGWLYQRRPEQLAQAITNYTKAIQLQPDDAKAYNNRGNALDTQGRLTEAMADYTKAIQLQPDYAKAYYNRGVALDAQGKLTEAMADYTKAIQLQPNYANAYNNRGVDLNVQGKLTEAVADYTKVIQLQPDDASGYNSLCWTYALQRQPEQALPNCQKAIQLDPQPAYYDSRGLAYALLNNFTDAIADFQVLVDFLEKQHDPTRADVLEKRKAWIVTLKAGQNPFSREVLDALRKE